MATPSETQAWPQSGQLNFASEDRLEEHWTKHGLNSAEFNPPLSRDEYLARARAFFASTEPDILHKGRDNGDSLRYRPSTNEFGVQSADAFIRTYFRPNTGMSYWERQ